MSAQRRAALLLLLALPSLAGAAGGGGSGVVTLTGTTDAEQQKRRPVPLYPHPTSAVVGRTSIRLDAAAATATLLLARPVRVHVVVPAIPSVTLTVVAVTAGDKHTTLACRTPSGDHATLTVDAGAGGGIRATVPDRRGRLTHKLVPRAGGFYEVLVVDRSRFADEMEPVSPPSAQRRGAPPPPPPQQCPRDADELVADVLVLVTPRAVAGTTCGGTLAGCASEVAHAVAAANADVLPGSGLQMRVRVPWVEALPADVAALVDGAQATERPSAGLRAVRDSAAVRAMRDRLGADAVCVMAASVGAGARRTCGIGYVRSDTTPQPEHAFSVVRDECFTDNYSWLHELGHNMGCMHGPNNIGMLYTSNGYGAPSGAFRTIMAYRSICGDGGGACTRIGRYSSSNSSLAYNGQAFGTRDHDNAGTVELGAKSFVQYRCQKQ